MPRARGLGGLWAVGCTRKVKCLGVLGGCGVAVAAPPSAVACSGQCLCCCVEGMLSTASVELQWCVVHVSMFAGRGRGDDSGLLCCFC